jgi:tetratricopeptide (TPR) repeat protein
MKVRSTPPEADVFVMLPGKESLKNLGKTPYTADISDLEELVNEGTIVVVIKKRGFVPQQFIVPNLSGKLEIEANLSPNLPGNYLEINKIIALVLRGQRELSTRKYKKVDKTIQEMKKINANISFIYELEGTMLFLQKKIRESRDAWIRSLELNPNNPEAQSMLNLIEKKLAK